MNAVTETTLSHDALCAFLYAEARALDDRHFDEWINFYHPDCPFWMPAWDDYDTLTEDPANEMSLIYYPNRGGIEDRVSVVELAQHLDAGLQVRPGCLRVELREHLDDLLVGHLDLARTVLVGHSRGGDAVVLDGRIVQAEGPRHDN